MGICGAGSQRIVASDLTIRTTRRDGEAPCGVGGNIGGAAVGLSTFADLKASRFSLAENEVGLGLLGPIQFQLSHGEIARNEVGIFAPATVDLRTSLDHVRFEGNDRAIDVPGY
jgi:hypothetical protein